MLDLLVKFSEGNVTVNVKVEKPASERWKYKDLREPGVCSYHYWSISVTAPAPNLARGRPKEGPQWLPIESSTRTANDIVWQVYIMMHIMMG